MKNFRITFLTLIALAFLFGCASRTVQGPSSGGGTPTVTKKQIENGATRAGDGRQIKGDGTAGNGSGTMTPREKYEAEQAAKRAAAAGKTIGTEGEGDESSLMTKTGDSGDGSTSETLTSTAKDGSTSSFEVKYGTGDAADAASEAVDAAADAVEAVGDVADGIKEETIYRDVVEDAAGDAVREVKEEEMVETFEVIDEPEPPVPPRIGYGTSKGSGSPDGSAGRIKTKPSIPAIETEVTESATYIEETNEIIYDTKEVEAEAYEEAEPVEPAIGIGRYEEEPVKEEVIMEEMDEPIDEVAVDRIYEIEEEPEYETEIIATESVIRDVPIMEEVEEVDVDMAIDYEEEIMLEEVDEPIEKYEVVPVVEDRIYEIEDDVVEKIEIVEDTDYYEVDDAPEVDMEEEDDGMWEREMDEEEKDDVDEIFELFSVSEKAEYAKGGDEGFTRYLSSNIVYPKVAQEVGVEGRVIVSFIVNEDGTLSGVETVGRKIGYGLEEEALRIVKTTSGDWNPAKTRGKPVKMRFRVPVAFKLY